MLDPQQPIWVVDAFSAPPHLGNPAAVILLDDAFPDTGTLQRTAASLAFPTLAIVVRGAAAIRIRWFTPQSELNLCGHASLAAAAVIAETQGAMRDPLCFETVEAGQLSCHRRGGAAFSLDLPASELGATRIPAEAARALGTRIERAAISSDDFIYELADSQAVVEATPHFAALGSLPWRGHVITAPGGDAGVDFVSRSFFPALGVDEDQVCVSAHCKLAPYWAARLGKTDLIAVQLSPRGGMLKIKLAGDRVHVEGQARIRRRSTLAAECATANGGLYRD